MSRDRTRIAKRNAKIEAEFNRLSEKKYNGKVMYKHIAVLEMVADKFYLSPSRIEDILKGKK